MPPSSRIPPLLQPYTRLPKDDSVLLLTSTLGASANWLIVRFLCEALAHNPTSKNAEEREPEDGGEDVAVILVSWMRDWEYWKSEARKGGGLDLERLKRDKRLIFVDGLSKMFLPEPADERLQTSPSSLARPSQSEKALGTRIGRTPQTVLPVRGPQGRIPARTPAQTPTSSANSMSTVSTSQTSAINGGVALASSDLGELQHTVENAIQQVQSTTTQRKTLLILDTPSFLLASDPSINPSSLSSTILRLHTLTTHVLLHIPADDALLSLSTPPQPLEIEGHNFMVKAAHMSARILSCRVLDTGVARDVSGVLRVTENIAGLWSGLEDDAHVDDEQRRGKELLYLVKGDGSVRVFERGSGGDV